MESIFLAVLDMSFKASFLILAVVLLRLVLKSSPRYIICLMWLLVGLRLVLPFSVESTLSLIPQREDFPSVSTEQIQPTTQAPEESDYTPVISTPTETPEPQIPVTTPVVPVQPSVTEPVKEPLTAAQIAATVWLCGLAAMLIYLAVSYILLRRRLAEAVPVGEGVWKCASVRSPFVLGFFRPRVYVSYGMSDEQTAYVLAHEHAHIARRDHWIKPIGFVILALHWFNPLVWLAYTLLCRDIELACDERVIKTMTLPERKGYSEALLMCSVKASPLAACPLAFGEAGVKQRIKSVLHYKKPGFWIIIAAIVCCVAAGVFFLTDPREEPDFDCPEEVQSLVYDFLDACTVGPEEALPYRYLPTEEMEEFYSTGRRLRSYEVENISPINELLYSFTYSARLESEPGSEYAQKYGRFQSLTVVNYAACIDGKWQVISEFEDIPDYILRGEADGENSGLSSPIEDNSPYLDAISSLLERHEDKLPYADVLSVDRELLFPEYAGQVVMSHRYSTDPVYVENTTCVTDDIYYWYDETGKATPQEAAQALVKVMLDSINMLPEDERTFKILDYNIPEQSLYSREDLVEYLSGSAVFDLDELSYDEAVAEIERVFKEELEAAPIFDWLPYMIGLGSDMWVLDPQFTFDYEGLCNMYSREEMDTFGFIAEDGLCREMQQGGDSVFVHVIIRSGKAWRMQRVEALAKYVEEMSSASAPPAIPADAITDTGSSYPLAVPMGSSVLTDLDGDGVQELIQQETNARGRLFFTLNGVSMDDAIKDMGIYISSLYPNHYYITDLDASDGMLEITLYDEGPSGDPEVHFFRYDGGDLNYLGVIPEWFERLKFDGAGSVDGSFRMHILQTWWGYGTWKLNASGIIEQVPQEVYYSTGGQIFDWVTGEKLSHHPLAGEVYAYRSMSLDSDRVILGVYDEIVLLGTDLEEWILVETRLGSRYWLHMTEHNLDTPEGAKWPGDVIMFLGNAD